ncbi:MAG: XdhC/CoxI family protein [Chitinophagaceae bacterium]|nr:MAG: XdhC/CoxI family protein [Chitinophagaceae bacterium]
MKEIKNIVDAYKSALAAGRRSLLATVVHVEGSSYRRPGARMLVEDNGQMTGAISGGCLEGDALRKALQAIAIGQNKLVTYNTMHEDDVEFGIQLGCNGIVHILFEPIDPRNENNPVTLLERSLLSPEQSVLVTLFSMNNIQAQPGTCYFSDSTISLSNIMHTELETVVRKDVAAAFQTGSSVLKNYTGFEVSAFVEVLQPPVSLAIIGAGNDVMPLVDMAEILGWKIAIADGRRTHANKQRFPEVHSTINGKPASIIQQLQPADWPIILLMTHNYNYDREMLKLLLPLGYTYIGTLGPKNRLERMIAELETEGFVISDEQRAILYGPTGLDIGAETPEEIAVSVIAEIKAVVAGRSGESLRDRVGSIHNREEVILQHTNNGG